MPRRVSLSSAVYCVAKLFGTLAPKAAGTSNCLASRPCAISARTRASERFWLARPWRKASWSKLPSDPLNAGLLRISLFTRFSPARSPYSDAKLVRALRSIRLSSTSSRPPCSTKAALETVGSCRWTLRTAVSVASSSSAALIFSPPTTATGCPPPRMLNDPLFETSPMAKANPIRATKPRVTGIPSFDLKKLRKNCMKPVDPRVLAAQP